MSKHDIELIKAKTYKLEEGKNYLLVFDNHFVSMAEAEHLINLVKKDFKCNTLGFVMRGDINSFKVVEVPETIND
jgi:hypothetical protein